MEPEPEKIDLSALDPGGWERKAAAIAARSVARHRFRKRVQRGAIATVLAAAAAIAVWFGAPRREAPRDVEPGDVLGLGGNDAR